MTTKVLLIGGGLQGISCARSLKNVGYNVAIITAKSDYAAKSTAFSNRFFVEKDIDLVDLENILSTEYFDVLVPMSDHAAFLISKYKNLIHQKYGAKCAAPSLDIITKAADKSKLMAFCKLNGLPHPRTINLKDGIPTSFIWPALIKPERSVGARGIRKVHSIEEMLKHYPIIKEKFGECQLQEFIDNSGPYFNVMIYRDNRGNILGHTILKIIRYYPIGGGSSSMCQTIEDETLLKICTNTLNKLDYIGFADFDVLQTLDGEYKIIEINPRVPASLRGASISGVNFPAIIVADTLKKPIPKYHYSPGKILRYLGLDLLWFLKSNKRFKSKPSWFNFFGKNIYYQEGGWVDKEAMIAALLHNLSKIEFKNGKLKKKE